MSVTVDRYHLFQRKISTGTYYWYENQGKRVMKACGSKCETKREAVTYLEHIVKEELTEKKRQNNLMNITLGEYAKDMFIEGAPHLIRWAAKGRVLKRQMITQHHSHLERYLIPRFGHMHFQDIRPTAVEDFLLEQKLSNSCRNTITYTLKTIMREARRVCIIDMIPEFEPFKQNGRRQDTLSSADPAALFPYDYDELLRVWRRPKHSLLAHDRLMEDDYVAELRSDSRSTLTSNPGAVQFSVTYCTWAS